LAEQLLKSAQTYSTPFIKDSLKGEFDTQKESLKGQYFKDASRQYFKRYPGLITNKELDELFTEGGFDAVVEAIDSKRDKPTGEADEAKKLLDAANAKIDGLQTEVERVAAEANERADKAISKYKTHNVLRRQVAELLKTKTNKPSDKQAEAFIKIYEGDRAIFGLDDSEGIKLLDPRNPETVLKNGDTKFMTLENLVDSYVDEYGLKPAAPPQDQKPTDPPKGVTRVDDDNKIISSADHIRAMLSKKQKE
jgi:hypothetical protein